VLATWLAGIVLLTAWNLGGWWQAHRLTRRDARPAPSPWDARFTDLRNRLNINRAVKLLESARVTVPAVIGCLRPVVLVPASAFTGLSPQQLEAVLAHELAHVRRHDYLINLLQAAVETLLFYHPAVWWASRQVRIERESCCDDVALAVCGDRLGYARALATLEGQRAAAPRLALAANGGSLLARIRRIAGLPAEPAARPSGWLTGAIALALLAAFLLFPHGGDLSAAPPAPARPAQASPARRGPVPPLPPLPPIPPAPSPSLTSRSGEWSAERREGGVQLEMSIREVTATGRHTFEENNLYPEKELIGFGTQPEARFEIRRAAGTFHFRGSFDGDEGDGTFTFEGNPAYVREMATLGYQLKDDNLLQLALFDVSPAFVRELKGFGYDRLPLDKLINFRIHGVSADFVQGLTRAGYRNIPPDRLVDFKIHGVTTELVQALQQAGCTDLTPKNVIQLRIHGISPDYLRQLASVGYRGLAADDLVQMHIYGISADFIREQQKKGRTGLSVAELVDLKIHGGR
jgi:hypothetical protein